MTDTHIRGSSTTRVSRAAALIVVSLLLNAISLLPALHDHGRMHDPDTCAVCQFQATSVWTPAHSAPVPAVQATEQTTPEMPCVRYISWVDHRPPNRGPPAIS
ncbi:MAG: hypothetical protein J7M38_06420 [Armatimonadetes bacterium]|nr:hypothetical protein [Armatimonadota bacterium]